MEEYPVARFYRDAKVLEVGRAPRGAADADRRAWPAGRVNAAGQRLALPPCRTGGVGSSPRRTRFLAVGGLATIVAFLIFNFLVHGFATGYDAPLSGQPYLAYAIANVVGMVVSYRGSRSWVQDRPRERLTAAG